MQFNTCKNIIINRNNNNNNLDAYKQSHLDILPLDKSKKNYGFIPLQSSL